MACFCAAFVLSGAVLTSAADSIVLTNGETINGRITSDKPETITIIDASGAQRPVQASQIKMVFRELQGKTEWNSALERLEYDQTEAALKLLKTILTDLNGKVGDPDVFQYAWLYAAQCADKLAKEGKNTKENLGLAAQYYESYVDKIAKGRALKEAVNGAVRCYMALENYEKVKGLLNVYRTTDAPGAALLEGQIALLEERWDAAVKAVSDVKTDAGKAINAQALVGKNDLDGAKKIAEEIIASASAQPADLAVAYLTVGDIYFRSMKTQPTDDDKSKNPKDALVEYLRVHPQVSEHPEI